MASDHIISLPTAFLSLLSEVILEIDKEGVILYANSIWNTLLDRQESTLGKKLSDFIFFEDMGIYLGALSGTKDSPQRTIPQVRIVGNNSKILWMHAVLGKTESGYFVILRDDTELALSQNKLEKVEYFDVLTGLPNRSWFIKQLSHQILESQHNQQKICIAHFDLDNFKRINERFGYDFGDRVLAAFSKRTLGLIHKPNLLARIGGDEFALMLISPGNRMQSNSLLASFCKAASKPIKIDNHFIDVQCSVGACIFPDDSLDADELVRHAEKIMHKSKSSGKNQINFFDLSSDIHDKSTVNLISEIKNAIINDDFALYYQPKVDLSSLTVSGAEALIRWNHSTKGFISPNDFLPFVANHAISLEIGKWVIKNAIKHLADWNAINLRLSVSVNVGAAQLRDESFIKFVKGELLKYRSVKPSQITFEILESSALGDVDLIKNLIYLFKEIGISFGLDDFGTGYSSLSHLRHLPVDFIKIDRSFVTNLHGSRGDLAIVKSVIALSELFNCEVLAEGIESLEMISTLRNLGCKYGQGYYFSRPLSKDHFTKWCFDKIDPLPKK